MKLRIISVNKEKLNSFYFSEVFEIASTRMRFLSFRPRHLEIKVHFSRVVYIHSISKLYDHFIRICIVIEINY